MREIGTIKQVQIQRSSLKVGERNPHHYDPSPLLVVRHLMLTSGGCIGITESGEQIIDVHHQDHPDSRNRGDNNISFSFTSHYLAMRDKFGHHLVDGCAGENILIEADKEFSIDELHYGIAIQAAPTGELIHLIDVCIATPCLPFSRFAAQYTSLQVKEPLQFLHHGKRGFYAALNSPQLPATIQSGQRIFAL